MARVKTMKSIASRKWDDVLRKRGQQTAAIDFLSSLHYMTSKLCTFIILIWKKEEKSTIEKRPLTKKSIIIEQISKISFTYKGSKNTNLGTCT